jgi:dTDP-glucose 4,6-dehydratase
MKTVLVTGASGFIFQHFVELLLKNNYKVINIDKLTYASNLNFKPSSPHYSFIKADVKDLKELPYCDYLVHAAACSHVDRSISKNDEFVDSNILGTHNILELLRNKKVEHLNMGWEYKQPTFIYVSTDEVFGSRETGFFKEHDKHNPRNPYSSTKSCGEQLTTAWGETYGLPHIITRTTNNFGEAQHPEKLIPHAITQLMKGETIKIHGDGSYIRNWIYVKDNCDAILKIMENGKNGETYHISSNEEYSVLEIVEMIAKKFNKNVEDVIEFIPNRSSQDQRYALDSGKIQKELTWTQKYCMNDVLDDIIEYYKNAKLV